MEIFIASRLSNGNGLFPTEIHLDSHSLRIIKPGLIAAREKTIKYDKISSIEIISPFIGFSKLIFSCYGLDNIIVEGFERADAEECRYIVEQRMR